MTRAELINIIAESIARHEGFYVTQAEAQNRGTRWPTRAQRNRNPGNLRRWDPAKDKYDDPDPRKAYVIFDSDAEGWRVLRKLCGQYLDGKYNRKHPNPRLRSDRPSLYQWFGVYAPTEDANNPESYAAGVAKALTAAGVKDVSVDRPVVEYITEG